MPWGKVCWVQSVRRTPAVTRGSRGARTVALTALGAILRNRLRLRTEITAHSVVDCYGSSVLSCRLISPLANGIKTSLIECRSKGVLDCQVLDLTGPADNASKYDHSTTLNILRYYRVNSGEDFRRDDGSRIGRRAFTASWHSSDGDARGSASGYGLIWMPGMICGLVCHGWVGSLDWRRG